MDLTLLIVSYLIWQTSIGGYHPLEHIGNPTIADAVLDTARAFPCWADTQIPEG
jgi:hypothetical protein